MSETVKHSRRVALSALVSVSAVALFPAGAGVAEAIAAEPAGGPDSELLTLIAVAPDLQARFDAATAALEEAESRTAEESPIPSAMIAIESDRRFWPAWPAVGVGKPYTEERILEISGLRERVRSHPEHEFCLALGGRADELIAAADQWRTARRQAEERSGEVDAATRCDQLGDEWTRLLARIATTPARTMAGILAKLAVAAPYFAADELGEHVGMDGILTSVAVDFNALERRT